MMANENDTQSRPRKEMAMPAKVTNIVVLLVLLGVSAYIILRVVGDGPIMLFTYHPTFMVLGYLILMSNAILIMADNNFLTSNLTHQNRVTAHWVVQVCALVLIFIAEIAIFANKVKQEKPHFQTTHSIFGVITFVLTLLTCLGGVWTKYSFQLRNIIKPTLMKIFHAFFAIVAYVLAIITIILGFRQMWFEDSDEYMKPIITILLILTAIYVLIKSFILMASRAKDYLNR